MSVRNFLSLKGCRVYLCKYLHISLPRTNMLTTEIGCILNGPASQLMLISSTLAHEVSMGAIERRWDHDSSSVVCVQVSALPV
jgi:hypothetical protein